MFAELAEVERVILAVSGGPDSTALLFLAARWRAMQKQGPELIAVTIDHGLRRGSGREAAAIKRIAARLGVRHRTRRWTGQKPASSIQRTAREHRYRLLISEACREGARHILTGHTLDDQAETVLFRLVRGSGVTGLAGMARATPLDGVTLVRPLLGIPKCRLVATLDAAGIPFAEDPSNQDPRFARTWLRQLMPSLARRGLDRGRLAKLAHRMERAERALSWATEPVIRRLFHVDSAKRLTLGRADLAGLPDEIVLRLFGRAIAEIGGSKALRLGRLEELVALTMACGSGWCVRRTLGDTLVSADAERVVFEPAPPRRSSRNRSISSGGG